MLNRLASLVMSTSVLKALPGKLDIKRHSSSNLYVIHKDEKGNKVLLLSVSEFCRCMFRYTNDSSTQAATHRLVHISGIVLC